MKKWEWRWHPPKYCRFCGRRLNSETGYGSGGFYRGVYCSRADCKRPKTDSGA